MVKIINKIFIWIFDKYFFDEWVERQQKAEFENAKKKYNISTKEEWDEILSQPSRAEEDAYGAGIDKGLELADKRDY